MDALKQLARMAVKHGLTPEAIGPPAVFGDADYVARYLGFTRTWDSAPAKPKTQERARKEWDRLLARMETSNMTKASSHPGTGRIATRIAPRR